MPTVAETRDDVLRLRALYDALADVLAREDWSALADVDQQIATYLTAVGPCVGEPQRVHARKRLQALHVQARKHCEVECDRLRDRLRDYLERAEGRSAYQQSEFWQGGAL